MAEKFGPFQLVLPPIICAQWSPANAMAICTEDGKVIASVAPWIGAVTAERLASVGGMPADTIRTDHAALCDACGKPSYEQLEAQRATLRKALATCRSALQSGEECERSEGRRGMFTTAYNQALNALEVSK